MEEIKQEVKGKFFDQHCSICPSLMRFELKKSTDGKTMKATVFCRTYNPACGD